LRKSFEEYKEEIAKTLKIDEDKLKLELYSYEENQLLLTDKLKDINVIFDKEIV